MGADLEIQNSPTGAKVTSGDLHTRLRGVSDPDAVGAVVVYGESHDGAAGIPRVLRPVDISHDFRTRVGLDTVMFADNASAHVGKYQINTSTMTTAITAGMLALNSGNSSAANAFARAQTYAEFNIGPSMSAYVDLPFKLTAAPATGQIVRIGGVRQSASATANADDGFYIELSAAGVWQLTMNFNILGGGTSTTVALTGFTPIPNRLHMGLIVFSQYFVDCYIDGVLYATTPRAVSNGDMLAFGSFRLGAYISNGAGALASFTQLHIGKWGVTNGDGVQGIPYPVRMSMAGNAGDSIVGTGAITANISNSAAPASATLSNSAAGYAFPDGNFQWAAVAGAATDYALFAYQVPAATSSVRGQSMLIHGATIDLENAGAVNSATVPTTVRFFLAIGGTALSLATADSAIAGSRAARRRYLGSIQIPVNAVIGQPGDRTIRVAFASAAVVEPGTFVHLIARITSGVATASQVISGSVHLDKHYSE